MTFDTILDIFLDVLKDSAIIFPFLVLTYILIEFLQRKASLKDGNILKGKFAPFMASAVGLFPSCSASVMAAKLYEIDFIKTGTLLSVFIASSDEAFALLVTHGKIIPLLTLLGFKFALAVIVGFIVNAFAPKRVSIVRYKGVNAPKIDPEEYCTQCIGGKAKTKLQAYLWFPLLHALRTFAFVFAISFAFGIIVDLIGEENISAFMQNKVYLQPALTALVGMIPNCASSILITQLYIDGGIAFGSMFAGLSVNAGVGLAIVLKDKKKIGRNLVMLLILYSVSVGAGMLLNLLVRFV